MARTLHERLAQPNVYVKIPGTVACLPAIEQMISEGKSVNVTLIFSLERYDAVIDAYLRGLERLVEGGGDASKVSSVASFFVSRVDTEVDKRLDVIIAAGGAAAETAKEDPGPGSSPRRHGTRLCALFRKEALLRAQPVRPS